MAREKLMRDAKKRTTQKAKAEKAEKAENELAERKKVEQYAMSKLLSAIEADPNKPGRLEGLEM